MTIKLSRVQPDFTSIRDQLLTKLTGRASWRGLLTTDTANILIEYISAAGAFLQDGLQLSFEEGWTDTAKLESSLRAVARTLSVRMSRKFPARTENVTLSRTATALELTIPPYSQFTAPNRKLFNREAIVFDAGQASISVTLYEGEIRTSEFTGTGNDFQVLEIQDPDFVVSDLDVVVSVDSDNLQVVQDGLWHYKNITPNSQLVVQDRTLATGELEVIFGNSLFGYVPDNGSLIQLTYAITSGTEGNDVVFAGKNISYDENSDITGVATAALSGGADEVDAETYRISPLMYASHERAVSTDDHDSLALNYSGIADARFHGQRLIAPTVKEYSNVVYAYILMKTGTVISQSEFDSQFLSWLHPRAMPFTYLRGIPVSKNVDVVASIYCRAIADLAVVRQAIIDKLDALFTPRFGYLGRNLYASDIYNAIRTAHADIDYIKMSSPTGDTICFIEPPKNVNITASASAGSLTDGVTYQYSISCTTEEGETFGSSPKEVVLAPGQTAIDLDWEEVAGATGYRVYGRSEGNLEKLVADLAANVTSYTDTGAATLGTPINTINTSGLFYATRNLLNLTMAFSDRTSN